MYPIESLRIIAPIFLFVLIAVNIVIGVFAGWKRAAYWGGGNFVFFIIGTLIWRGCSGAIVSKVEPLITNLLKDLGVTSGLTSMVKPVCAIIFGIAVILVTNLILVINYYAWFKKVAKIGKYSNPNWKKEKAAKKAAKKEGKKKAATTAVKVKKSNQGLKMQLINKIGGGVGFTALMLPPLFSTTTGIMYATTCTGTRYNNDFVNGFYGAMNTCNKAFSWMSYYDKDAGDNVDGLMTTLRLGTGNIDYIKYGATAKTNANAFSAIFDVIGNGISEVIKNTTDLGSGYGEITDPTVASEKLKGKLDTLIKSYKTLDKSWVSVIQGSMGVDIKTLFNSEPVMALMPTIIAKKVTSKTEIKSADWDKYYNQDTTGGKELGYFWQVLKALGERSSAGYVTLSIKIQLSGGESTITAISSETYTVPTTLTLNTKCFEYLLDGMFGTMNVDEIKEDATKVATMKKVAAWMCGLMFYNEEYAA